MKRLIGILIALAMVLAIPGSVMAAEPPSISPSEVDEVIFPGGSVEIEKTVQTPVIAPKPDILFLADTTGSMGTAIANVQANATTIMNTILAAAPDARFGVANYKDYQYPDQYDPYVTQWQVQMTDDTTAVQAAINTWSATGGSDWSEGWLASLDRAANPAAPGNPGWRDDSTKIIVIFGDAPAHDPVPQVLTGLDYDVTEATVTADLQAQEIKLVAVSLSTFDVTGYFPDGLDDDPLISNTDYPTPPPQVGTSGQASRIAATTDGKYLFSPTAEEVSDYILSGLTSLPITVSMTSDCDGYVTTSFEPVSQVVISGEIAYFTETISVAADAPGGTYECRDWVLIDGEPMVDEAGEIIYENKTIRVPEGFFTGGGQIVAGEGKKKDQNVISFAGNVAFMADSSLIGQWQTNFHNVGIDKLDGARFHSTSIEALQFANDGGDGPYPPPADANIASFTAIGRLNGEDGWTLAVRLADRGEPGINDSIRLVLTDPDSIVVYDSYLSGDFPEDDVVLTTHNLASGNLQIHSGINY